MRYIHQLDETDCGAACLAMVASHYKSHKSVGSIREIAGTDTKGTNLTGMVQAAQKMGFCARALKGNKDALAGDLPCPFIAHVAVKQDGYVLMHYVVGRALHGNHIAVIFCRDSVCGCSTSLCVPLSRNKFRMRNSYSGKPKACCRTLRSGTGRAEYPKSTMKGINSRLSARMPLTTAWCFTSGFTSGFQPCTINSFIVTLGRTSFLPGSLPPLLPDRGAGFTNSSIAPILEKCDENGS